MKIAKSNRWEILVDRSGNEKNDRLKVLCTNTNAYRHNSLAHCVARYTIL